MPENIRSECFNIPDAILYLEKLDREIAHEVRVILEKIEAFKNPVRKLIALRLFSEWLRHLTE